MISGWDDVDKRDYNAEVNAKALRKLGMAERKQLLFDGIRAHATNAMKELLSYEPILATEVMYGYEGSAIHAETESGRCYHYTAQEKDGFFSPLHLAAESGDRALVTILLKDFDADPEELDYRKMTAEEKCTQESRKAFFEMRGLHFEAMERYTGGKHQITGKRNGTGTLYFKPEGYECPEKILYRGTFKDDVYHGQGALFWPGSDVMQYQGRFKGGVKHGRGVMFDSSGNKIYHGTFRDDKKDGRGELFEDVEGTFTRTYHGEFENDQMHGFGVALYGSGGSFVGRFEYGMKAGVGVYAYPNGDRFEGMFFGDKPDGKGSYYTPTADGKETGSHFMWQNGRKTSQVDTPFVPDKLDMPEANEDDINNNTALTSILNSDPSDDASVSSADTRNKKDGSSKNNANKETKNSDDVSKEITSKLAFLPNPSGKDWKQQLGKAVRISGKTAKVMGMKVPESEALNSNKKDAGKSNSDEVDEEDESEEEPDMDDVISSHFLRYAPLLTAYVYSCSASKVFEGRSAAETDSAAQNQLPMFVPEFDAVNHLVMDAVEDYNERWEKAFAAKKAEEAEVEAQKVEDGDGEKKDNNDEKGGHHRSSVDLAQGAGVVSQIKNNNVFLTEAEKRKELKRKQRAELAARKGGGALGKDMEDEIGNIVYDILEKELCELTTDDGTGMGGEDMDVLLPTRSYTQRQRKHGEYGATDDTEHEHDTLSNEFATELLYLLRMAKSVI
jgi:hypothetical protein